MEERETEETQGAQEAKPVAWPRLAEFLVQGSPQLDASVQTRVADPRSHSFPKLTSALVLITILHHY